MQGAKQDGTRQNHDSFLGTLARWLARAKIPHMGGKYGNPRTYKGLFSRIPYRLAQMEKAADTADEDKAFKIRQHILLDLVINGRSLSGNGFLAAVSPSPTSKPFHHAAPTLTTAPAIPTQ